MLHKKIMMIRGFNAADHEDCKISPRKKEIKDIKQRDIETNFES
jgi:hypothetical protein